MARREGHRPRLALLPPHSESSITCKIDAKPVFIKLIPTQIQALGGESGRPRLPFPEGVHQTQDRLHSFYPWWQLAQLCNPRAQSTVWSVPELGQQLGCSTAAEEKGWNVALPNG